MTSTNEDTKTKWFVVLVVFNITSVIVLSMVLIQYVMWHDYLFYPTYNVAVDLQSKGLLTSAIVNFLETAIGVWDYIPQFIDIFWLSGFIGLVLELFYVSYNSRRWGYGTLIGFMTFGILFFMLITSVSKQFSDWLYTVLITNLLGNLSLSIPFFSGYLSYYGIINLAIVCGCIILNFVDLDFSKFFTRKDKEITFTEVN